MGKVCPHGAVDAYARREPFPRSGSRMTSDGEHVVGLSPLPDGSGPAGRPSMPGVYGGPEEVYPRGCGATCLSVLLCHPLCMLARERVFSIFDKVR